jgi:hypothetical protein
VWLQKVISAMSSTRTVAELVEILYGSTNDAWRDDAAQELALASDRAGAEAALVAGIESPGLDDSLRRTCAESLASIWIDQGYAPATILSKLDGMPKDVIDAFLRAAAIGTK